MVTGVQKEITYCSPGRSSGKRKKTHFALQPQFSSENSSALIESQKILLALQHLENNKCSANINIKVHQNSKFLKPLTTTMPSFILNSEKFEQFGDFFKTSVKIHNQLTEDDKIN